MAYRYFLICVGCTCLVACSTLNSARVISESRLGPVAPGALRLYISTERNDRAEWMLLSGSVYGGASAASNNEQHAVLISSADRSKLTIAAIGGAVAGDGEKESLAEWGDKFQNAYSETSAKVFGSSPPFLNLTIIIAPHGASIDHVYLSPLREPVAEIEFEIPEALASNAAMRPVTTNLIAHEIYHAIVYSAAKDRVSAMAEDQLPALERSLGEAAAMLFGQCVSLIATGVSIQDKKIEINGRPGGVMTDGELKEALSGALDELDEKDMLVIGEAIGNTMWSSRVAARTQISAGDDAARNLAALCTEQIIGSPLSLVPLLTELAEDGEDAAPVVSN